MDNDKLLTAYHESGRVVFAYFNQFACDVMDLHGEGTGTGSKLNAGADIKLVQAVFSGDPSSLLTSEMQKADEVINKLLQVYCAGTCTRIYYQNGQKIPTELQVDIAGQDIIMIQKIEKFSKKAHISNAPELVSDSIVTVFKKLKDPDTWKAIEMLAKKLLEEGTLKRFHIEDTLMVAGMPVRKPSTKSGFGVGLHEEEEEEEEKENEKPLFKSENLSPLDVMVRDFLKQIKSNWTDTELKSATDHLHEIYKKYG